MTPLNAMSAATDLLWSPVLRKFPDIKFEHNTGYKRTENVGTYDGRFYEGRAVTGTIAGRMTQSNKIGYIATFPIPEVIRGINAFTLGVVPSLGNVAGSIEARGRTMLPPCATSVLCRRENTLGTVGSWRPTSPTWLA